MSDRITQLDAALDDVRVDLGLQWIDVAHAADISLSTLDRVRKGAGTRLTRRAVERALRLRGGSIDAYLAGDVDTLAADSESAEATADPERDRLRAAYAEYRKTHTAEEALAWLSREVDRVAGDRAGRLGHPGDGQRAG